MSTEEGLPPNFGKLDVALRSIGYSFEAAVADVIDNSIDAGAKDILVRIITKRDAGLDLVICDDGDGMSANTLKEAMRFGADVSQELNRLGKFGLGLKLASLSQAREVHVISVKDGSISGRAWLEHGIASNFACTVFDPRESAALLAQVMPHRDLEKKGTIVWWSRLYRVGQNHTSLEEHAQKLMRRLENYLALAFHRFLSGRSRTVRITIDIFDEKVKSPGIPIPLDPLDPFEYSQSGNPKFPMEMSIDSGYEHRISIRAHIWPPNSVSPSYRLPGGANSRQGFYFYRNNRLIQGAAGMVFGRSSHTHHWHDWKWTLPLTSMLISAST